MAEDSADDSWDDEDYFDCYLCQCPAVGLRFCESCEIDYCGHPICLEKHERIHRREAELAA